MSGTAGPGHWLLDAHIHLDPDTRVPDVEGVGGFWIGGTDLRSFLKEEEAFGGDPRVRRSVGLHPWFLPPAADLGTALDELRRIVAAGRAAAVGECGLDRGRRAGPWDTQLRAFEAQVDLALETRLPLVLHVVRSHEVVIDHLRSALRRHGRTGCDGIVHAFSGGMRWIEPFTALGLHLGIGPREFRDTAAVRAIPPDAILIETDDAGAQLLPDHAKAVVACRGRGEDPRTWWPRWW